MESIICCPSCEIEVSWARTAGIRNRNANRSCEDVIFLKNTRDYLYCGLADGQSGTRYGAEGGQACLETICDYIGSVGIDNMLNAPFPDELPCDFAKIFRRTLLSLAEERKTAFEEFASTLLIAAVEQKTGTYMLLHLGDGCAISVPGTGEPVVISGPDTGLTACHTWLTTSGNAVSHLRVRFGTLENKKRLMLLSDGAVCFCRGENIPWRIKERLCREPQPQLREILLQSNPRDDASCIILDVHNGEEDAQKEGDKLYFP